MKRMRDAIRSRWPVLLGLTALLVGCSDSAETPTEPGMPIEAEVELLSFQLANQARNQEGVRPRLDLDDAVSAVARGHSEAMRDRNFFGHTDHNGAKLRDRLRAAGISSSKAAENLAKVSSLDPAGVAHQEWMASPGHRANILDSQFRLAGVGVARKGDTFWITQVFIKP